MIDAHDSGELPTSVRLRRGTVPRTVRISISTPLAEPDRIAPRRALDAFLAAVDAGLFGTGRVIRQSHRVLVVRDHDLVIDVVEAELSSIAPDAFTVIAAMVRCSVPSAKRVEVHERHDEERVLVVRKLERDPEATVLDVEWEICFPMSRSPFLSVELRETPSQGSVARLGRLFEVWSEVVSLGAFPPSDGSPPAAELQEVMFECDTTVSARFRRLACGYDGFEALFQGVDRVHQEQPVARLAFGDGGR